MDADNVTIDLKGFTITGSNTDTGILTLGPQDNIVIRNGTIRDFDDGIGLGGDNCRIEWVIASSNAFDGIDAGFCDLNNNIANDNDGTGIKTVDSTIRNNIANDNVTDGIEALGTGNNIIYNTANGNGHKGIVVVCPSNLVGNTAQSNGVANLELRGPGCKHYNNLF